MLKEHVINKIFILLIFLNIGCSKSTGKIQVNICNNSHVDLSYILLSYSKKDIKIDTLTTKKCITKILDNITSESSLDIQYTYKNEKINKLIDVYFDANSYEGTIEILIDDKQVNYINNLQLNP